MSVKHDGIAVLIFLYFCSFGLFVVVGWGLRREIQTAQRLEASALVEAKKMREVVEGLNLKLGRYEQEAERRFVTMSEGCQAIRVQLYESMMTPEEQFQADVVQRLQRLEAHP